MTVALPSAFRLRRDDESRLAWAFVLSLLLHALIFGTWQLDRRYHFLERIQLPSWMFPPKRLAEKMVLPPVAGQPPQPPELEILPTEFVEVNPAVATADPPKQSKFYSTANSQAANPDADKEAEKPKFDGSETRFTRTEAVKVPSPQPLVAAPPAPKPVVKPETTQVAPTTLDRGTTTEPVEEQKPRATLAPGDLTLAKPSDTQRLGDGLANQSKPRTLKEAVARLAARDPAAAAGLVGERLKQDGGVKRRNVTSSLDVRSSPFADYDSAIIGEVQNRWYALLDSKNYAGEANGKLSLEFRLHQNGQVTDLKVKEQSVDEIYSIICQRAILDNAPYEKWPPDMRRMIREDYRDVTFTFYYN
jgi:hypothetical protein